MFDNAEWKGIMDVWKSGQISLPQVIRWSKYSNNNDEGGARVQDSLQHSYSLTILGKIVIYKLREYAVINESLLLTALLVHDHGEGEIKKDTLYIDKTVEGDVDEYIAFQKRYKALDSELYQEFERAFLLQFSLKNSTAFPESARSIMSNLAVQNRNECLIFDIIERLDYILYAFEQYVDRGNVKILVQTLRHQMSHLDRLSLDVTGLGEVIWTPLTRESFESFLRQYEGLWVEQKGEK